MFCSRDMASFACHDDQRLGSFSTKNTSILLDMITNGLVYEPLARSNDCLKLERLSLTVLGSNSRLDSFLLTHHHDISTWFVQAN